MLGIPDQGLLQVCGEGAEVEVPLAVDLADPAGPGGHRDAQVFEAQTFGLEREAGDVVDRLYRLGEVIKRVDEPEGTRITARLPSGDVERFAAYESA